MMLIGYISSDLPFYGVLSVIYGRLEHILVLDSKTCYISTGS